MFGFSDFIKISFSDFGETIVKFDKTSFKSQDHEPDWFFKRFSYWESSRYLRESRVSNFNVILSTVQT